MKLTTDARAIGAGAVMQGLAGLALCLAAAPALSQDAPLALVAAAQVETEGTTGDTDDPAIWVNPADPARSLILGTDKSAGLYVYDLTGAVLQFLPDGHLNNVDLRPFTLNGQMVTIAGASRRDDETLVFYVIGADGTVVQASPWQHPAVPPELAGQADDIYGFAMAQDAGGTYALVNFKSGHVVQWQLTETAGQLSLTLARHWQVGTQPEGMVADDRAGHIYVGEEDRGIWRYALAPGAPAEATEIAAIPSACLPVDDVEGLAIHDGGADGQRYLVASAQGIHRAALFALNGDAVPACAALLEIVPGAVDGVTETDGLEVTALPVGPDYPQGLLVMMDDQNAGFTTNFKLVSWADVAAGLGAD